MIENHHLVNHRQFEVGVRVVNRDARVFGQKHRRKRGDDQREGDAGMEPEFGRDRLVDARHGKPRGLPRERGQAQKERHLGEGREEDLAARSHSFKRRARVKRGQHRDHPRQTEEIGEQHEVALKLQKRRDRAKGNESRRHDHRGKPDHWPRSENPCGRLAVNGPFVKEPPQVVIRLNERLARSSREHSLGSVRDSDEERSQPDGKDRG